MKKLNWTTFDNPFGWVEPTFRCQLKCIGCYRGIGVVKHSDDIELSELKNQIIWLKENRKVNTISIGGGEPLLYNQLIELIKFMKDNKLKSKLQTNGLLLDSNFLKKLETIGLNEILVHISEHQNLSINDVFDRKDKICNLFRRDGSKIKLGFIQPISNINFGKLNTYLNFYKENCDIIKKVTFCNYKDNPIFDKKDRPELEISFIKLIDEITDIVGVKFHSYLQKTISKNKACVFSSNYYDKKTKKLLGSYQKRQDIIKFKNSYRQDLILIDPPNYFNKDADFCDGCPDTMIYNGYLVPSCMLERFKTGQDIGQIKIENVKYD